jgi:phosphoribosylpyrophosphate synthetase
MLTQTRYFPYSRQSKKKSHRGAITARMLANLLTIAGVDHVITMDLHVCLYAMISLILWILMGS